MFWSCTRNNLNLITQLHFFKELRAKDTIQTKKADKKNATFRENNAGIISQLKSELILYKTRHNRAMEKEKRIKVRLIIWKLHDMPRC